MTLISSYSLELLQESSLLQIDLEEMLGGFLEPFLVNAAYPSDIGNTIASNSNNQRQQRREECIELCATEDSSLLHDLLSPGFTILQQVQ